MSRRDLSQMGGESTRGNHECERDRLRSHPALYCASLGQATSPSVKQLLLQVKCLSSYLATWGNTYTRV